MLVCAPCTGVLTNGVKMMVNNGISKKDNGILFKICLPSSVAMEPGWSELAVTPVPERTRYV